MDTDGALTFFISGRRAGVVRDKPLGTHFQRGQLSLDECPERGRFDAVVAMAHDVDVARPEDYQEKWAIWRRGCGELEELQLSIGPIPVRIGEFTIEADWTIEWRNIDDESVR